MNSHTMAASAMTAAKTKCCETKVVFDGAVNDMSSSAKFRSPSPERPLWPLWLFLLPDSGKTDRLRALGACDARRPPKGRCARLR